MKRAPIVRRDQSTLVWTATRLELERVHRRVLALWDAHAASPCQASYELFIAASFEHATMLHRWFTLLWSLAR